MATSRRDVVYLTADDILTLNRWWIQDYGGFQPGAGVPRDRDRLDYLIEAVESDVFGQELYPSLEAKAAAYAFYIIRGHIFIDGNKRTGMSCALRLLERNGCALKSLSQDEIVDVAMAVADRTMTLDDVTRWLQSRLE